MTTGRHWLGCCVAVLLSSCGSTDSAVAPPITDTVPRRDAGRDAVADTARSRDDDQTDGDAPDAIDGEPATQEEAAIDVSSAGDDAGEADADPPPDECETGVASQIVAPDVSWMGLCGNVAFGAAEDLPSASTVSDDRLASVTPDELTIAWLADYGGRTAIYYSDRAAANDVFGEVHVLLDDYYAAERAALSPDGLRLVVARADRRAFGEYARVARGELFVAAASEASFASIDRTLGLTLESAEKLGEPVIGADDTVLYYARYGGSTRQTVYAAQRSPGGSWPLGQPVLGTTLTAKCGGRRRVTGVSSDALTLFYWDELSHSTRAAFRSTPVGAFDWARDLGVFAEAQPNAACSRLYFSAPFAAGEDIAIANQAN